MTRRLVIFDIDGTLTQTAAVDETCYQEAIRAEWGVVGVSTDWGAYEHSTDNAIASEISRTHRGRDATDVELANLRDRFVRLLHAEIASRPERFRETPGAAAILRSLPSHGWSPAVATGGWTPSARLKLTQARVDVTGVPAAFACDARPREEIIRIAMRRAEEHYGGAFERAVYVGDGLWDLRAAARLGIGFLGVATGARAERFRDAGAVHLVADFRDGERFVELLYACMKPIGG
ncbi:MAG: haloacid dehalogenase-like hydrolase [Phycisphaerales bacterium]